MISLLTLLTTKNPDFIIAFGIISHFIVSETVVLFLPKTLKYCNILNV